MDRSSHVTLAGVLIGIVVGFPGGVLFQVVRAAWKGHASLAQATEGARKSAWRRTFEFALLGFLLLVFAAYALGQANDR